MVGMVGRWESGDSVDEKKQNSEGHKLEVE